MPTNDWKEFLTAFNQDLLASPKLRSRLSPAAAQSGWLGFPGASEAEIAKAEARIGKRLPPSYRSFLAFTDGWRNTGPFIHCLWAAADLAWFKERNQGWIDAYADPAAGSTPVPDEKYFVYGEEQDTVNFREAYLKTALEISDTGDACILLLNPEIVTEDGEWEAWFFANWYPGAQRFRSFRELMENEREKLQEMMHRQNAPAPAPKKTQARPGLLAKIRSMFGAKK